MAAVSFPAYDRYRQKGKRMDAITYLTQAAAFEENWIAENGAYTSDKTKLTKDGSTTTEHDNYAITVSAAGSTFSITAAAKGSQIGDTDCASFTIDNVGRKTAKKSDNSDNSSICWGR
ncbi:MAG: type IV pilin protein [Gammaproteobacteria bacterium]|nr:type IV pilin protein [Gammaproteobacteria bacterium]MCW8987558.1 type IV pilin protein [Gammaproteobacteria bacterium]MCW9031081.1 type IV pilin protein [Gammaproteobacteria bacterium]